MGPLYHALGLSVGVIQHEASFLYDPAYVTSDIRMTALRPCTRQEAYRADITYGTNNEFGFDYLRDNMRFTLEELVQRELHYAIVDEVDSILIDEARTPLIISGPAEESTDLYYKIDRIIPKLKRAATIVEGKLSEIETEKEGDYIVDEKSKAVALTEQGIESCERLLNIDNLYDPRNIDVLHHVQQGLRAHALYRRDVDYVVKDGEVIIVDEFTGRLMPGPALVRRPAPGGRGEGRRPDRAREPDARDDHLPELLPDVRQARRHDGHRGDRGRGVREDLQARRHGRSRPTARWSASTTPDVVYKTEREKFDAVTKDIIERTREGAAGAGRHGVDREVGAAVARCSSGAASGTRS